MSISSWIIKNIFPKTYNDLVQTSIYEHTKDFVCVKSVSMIDHTAKPSSKFEVSFYRISPTSNLHFFTLSCSEVGKPRLDPLYELLKPAADDATGDPSEAIKRCVEDRFIFPRNGYYKDRFCVTRPSSTGGSEVGVYISPTFLVDKEGYSAPDIVYPHKRSVLKFYDVVRLIDQDTSPSLSWILVTALISELTNDLVTIGQYESDTPVIRFHFTDNYYRTIVDFRIACDSAIAVTPHFKLLTPIGVYEKTGRYENLDCTIPTWSMTLKQTFPLDMIVSLCKAAETSSQLPMPDRLRDYFFATKEYLGYRGGYREELQCYYIRWVYEYGVESCDKQWGACTYIPADTEMSLEQIIIGLLNKVKTMEINELIRNFDTLSDHGRNATEKALTYLTGGTL